MINIHHSPVIGGATARGLWVPGAVIIGGEVKSEILAIDLTAETLDSRVTYVGPSHSYIAIDGKLKQSTANVWPLEYSDGAPVGRHEPERASVNYVPGVEYGSIGPSGSVSYDWNYGTAAMPTTQSSDMGIASATSTKTGALTAVYSEGTSGFIAAAVDGGSPSTWTLVKRQFTNASTALLRWYVARVSASDYLLARCSAVPAGSFTASVYRKVTTSGMLSAGAQLEAGTTVTSPIISATGQQGTRAASTLTIDTSAGSSIKIIYSNGDTDTYSTPDSTFTVPLAKLDWGVRRMKRIEFGA